MVFEPTIIKKNRNKSSIIGVIGLGYVGMPLCLSFVNEGLKVIGFDIDIQKIDQIKKKQSHIWSISSKDISDALSKGFEVTTDYSKISLVDIIIICVPTPLTRYNQPELKYIVQSIDSIMPYPDSPVRQSMLDLVEFNASRVK